jgi:hypothetical protein
MNSLTDHKFSVLLTGLLLVTGLGGIPTAFASSPSDAGTTTTDVEAAPTSTGQNHGGSGGHNLKMYGSALTDLNQDGDIEWTTATDLGNQDEADWDDEEDNHVDNVVFEPAYVEDGADGSNAENLMTSLSMKYQPTYWQPSSLSHEPGTGSALFDIANEDGNNDADFDPTYVFDEDVQSDIDSDSTDDPIDLLGSEDNHPDYALRNDDTGQNDDIYFPAFVKDYTFTTYTADHQVGGVQADERVELPVSGLGGQAGLNTYSAGAADTEVVIQALDDGNTENIQANGDSEIRAQTEDLKLETGDTIRFLDFQATLESVSTADDPSATWTVHWLGDYDSPEKVGSQVTTKSNSIVTANTGNVATPGDCDGQRPSDPASDNLWYLCPTTINGANQFVFATAGRLLAPAADSPRTGTLLVNGGLYHVQGFSFGNNPLSLQSLTLEQVVPTGEDFDLNQVDTTLKGVNRGDDIPVIPPFNGDHQAVEQFGLSPETDSHGFMKGDDNNRDGISGDNLDIVTGDEDVDDRLTDRSALQVGWEASDREEGLLANREEVAPGQDDWAMNFQNTYPNHYAEIDTPDGTSQLVESGLYQVLNGFDKFLFDTDARDPIQFVPDGLRLFGDTLQGGEGDALRPNPAIVTDSDAQFGNSDANVLVEPTFEYDPYKVYDQRDGDVSGTNPDAPSETDLNVLTDEENADFQGFDDNSDHNPVDQNTDNVFDFEGPQNNKDNHGDVYSPAIVQTYTHYWLKQGSNDPTRAAVDTAVQDGPADANTQLTLPVATDSFDSGGLDSCDVGGDEECEESRIEFFAQSSRGPGVEDDLRLESEKITVSLGERAQFIDHSVQVDSTDTSYSGGPRARLSFYQLDAGGDADGDEVGTGISGVNEDRFVGLTYNYGTGSSSLVTSPQQAQDLDHNDDNSLDYDWYVYVDTISADSITLSVGRIVPDNADMFVDGQQYNFEGTSVAGDMDNIAISTETPVGSETVDLVQPNVDIEAVGQGDSVPVLNPFDEEHRAVKTTGVPVESNQYGAYDNLGSDGDTTEESTSQRTVDRAALDLTVEDNGVLERQSFIYVDGETNSQEINGIFQGSDDDANDPNPVMEGPADAGWPDAFTNTPSQAAYGGESFVTGAWDEVRNRDRGFRTFVTLSFGSPPGEWLYDSERIEALDGANPAPEGASSVDWLPSSGNCPAAVGWNPDGDEPCIRAQPGGDAQAWFTLGSADMTDLFVGTGQQTEVNPCLEDSDSPECQGLAQFQVTSVSCPSEVTRGDSIKCDIDVTNQGSGSGDTTVELTGQSPSDTTSTIGQQSITLDAGASTTVSITWSTVTNTETGDWTLTGKAAGSSENAAVTVQEQPTQDSDGDGIADADDNCPNTAGTSANDGCPEPADVSVSDCSVSSSETEVGTTVRVTVTFENTGGQDGPGSADVTASDTTVKTLSAASVPAGGTADATDTVTISSDLVDISEPEPGADRAEETVSVAASGTDCGSVTAFIDAPEETGGGPGGGGGVPGFQAYALVSALVGAALLARRRRV